MPLRPPAGGGAPACRQPGARYFSQNYFTLTCRHKAGSAQANSYKTLLNIHVRHALLCAIRHKEHMPPQARKTVTFVRRAFLPLLPKTLWHAAPIGQRAKAKMITKDVFNSIYIRLVQYPSGFIRLSPGNSTNYSITPMCIRRFRGVSRMNIRLSPGNSTNHSITPMCIRRFRGVSRMNIRLSPGN